MARNDESYENAFQTAETGLEVAMASRNFNTQAPTIVNQATSLNESFVATIMFDTVTNVPNSQAYSLGYGTGNSAYHFQVLSQAASKPGGVAGPASDRDQRRTRCSCRRR